MSEQLFSQGTTTNPPAVETPAPSASPYADLLSGIKNERGEQKYATIEDALTGLAHAQTYIPEVKSQLTQKDVELNALREELAKRQSVEEVIASLTPTQPVEPVVEPTSQPSQGLNQQDVLQLVQATLEKQKAQDVSNSNISKVRSALVSKYGEKAQEVAVARASELGMSMESLSALSASSPDAVLALLGATMTSAPTGAPIRSTVHLQEQPREVNLTPEKSMLRGASSRDVIAYMERIRNHIKQENGLS